MQTVIKAYNQAGDEVGVKATEGGILVVMSQKVLWTAKGYGYQAMSTAGIAALVVRPSDTAEFTLFNDESGGGKHYVIERVMVHQLVSGAAQNFFQLWLCSHPVGMTKPTNDITVRNSTSGKAAGGSLAIVDVGATVVDNGWFPWGVAGETEEAGVLPGGGICADIDGRIIVPPQGGLSAAILSGDVNTDCTIGMHWYEVPESELAVA